MSILNQHYDEPPAISASSGGEDSALDMQALELARSSMKAKFATIVQYYLEDSVDYMSQIESAVANGQAGNAAAPAHTLKSSSKLLGAMRVSELSRQLEEASSAIGDGEQTDVDIAALVSALKQALAIACPRLEEAISAECA